MEKTHNEWVREENAKSRRLCKRSIFILLGGIILGFILFPTMIYLKSIEGVLISIGLTGGGFGGILGIHFAYYDTLLMPSA